jgi:hypothetical protein
MMWNARANPLTDSLLRVLRPTADQLHIELEIFDARGGGVFRRAILALTHF